MQIKILFIGKLCCTILVTGITYKYRYVEIYESSDNKNWCSCGYACVRGKSKEFDVPTPSYNSGFFKAVGFCKK